MSDFTNDAINAINNIIGHYDAYEIAWGLVYALGACGLLAAAGPAFKVSKDYPCRSTFLGVAILTGLVLFFSDHKYWMEATAITVASIMALMGALCHKINGE